MAKTNQCFLIGNLGADPARRKGTEKTGAVAGLSVAENVQTFDEKTKTYETIHTNWFHVTAFGPVAERVLRTLKKGDRVAIQGRMRTAKYVDKKGEEKMGFEIIAEDVALWKALASAS